MFLGPVLHAQESPTPKATPPRETFSISLSPTLADSLVRLPHQFIVNGTDTLMLHGSTALIRGSDYSINYRQGTIRFDSTFLARTPLPARVTAFYAYFPFTFQESYYRRRLITIRDSTGRDMLRIARPPTTFTVDDFFGGNLQKSGSLVRGFTIGTNRDLSLTSGLRLQLAGRISSDIDVAASLTDENTPIQPEGTTQTLQEFDKVFVEIRSSNVGATLGDFNLELGGPEFARLSRKLQGAQATAEYRTNFAAGSATIAGALTRGKFNTNTFQGFEGVQGPYRLSGRNGERAIIIIAGTERVYVDGERQVRGETNDYTIDYGTGEVTFTTRRLITSASRIVIDCEYSDRQFSRSLFAVRASSVVFSDRAKVTVTYVREADDPDAPIDFAITDSARTILQQAGGDRNKAVQSGIARVDSNGFYVQVDTVLVSGPARLYRYAPGDPNAFYNVSFSFVGAGKGDYVRQQVGVFVWRGPGNGEYLPLRFLPLPESNQVLDVAMDIAPTSDLRVSGEFANSRHDANRLSSLPESEAGGSAFTLSAAYNPRDVKIGGTQIGGFDLALRERIVQDRFVPIDRTNDIEFNRKWGIDTLRQSDERIEEASLRYLPMAGVTVGGGYGDIRRGDLFRSSRAEGVLTMNSTGLPKLDYIIENVRSKDFTADNGGAWLRQKGSAEYAFGGIVPGIRYESEDKRLSSMFSSAVRAGSYRFQAIDPDVTFRNLGKLFLRVGVGWRTDDSFLNGDVTRESSSFTQSYVGRLSEWNNVTSSLEITLRDKKVLPSFKQLGNADAQTVLVRSQSRYTPWNRALETDLFYEVSTQRSSRLERVFVRVAKGTGNYQYLDDLNHNGVADENEFAQARFDGDYVVLSIPTDQLYPIIDLQTSLRLRLTPARVLTNPREGWEKALAALSTETYVRAGEKSTERDLKQIYLLHLSRFQQDSTTLLGSTLFTQDISLFEGQPDFSARARYSERRGMNNFAGGIERSYGRERSVRLRWQLVPEFANQLDYTNKIDRLDGKQSSTRFRDVGSNDVTFDMSYRPEQNFELGLKFEVSKSTDRYPSLPLDAWLNAQNVRMVYAFQGAGQMRVEAAREETNLGRSADSFPYELTGGRVPGKTWLWRAALEYRLTNFVQASLNYDGRSEGGRSPVHTGRAEVRAFF